MTRLMVPNYGERVLNLASQGGGGEHSFEIERRADPNISPAYALPADFAAQFPNPLDPTEIVAMCEEITLWRWLPEEMTGLKTVTWRELNALAFTSGSQYVSFADGECPEEYRHDGDNSHVDLKNIGAKKTLGVSDIMHSMASISLYGGINTLVGPSPSSSGLPGGGDITSFTMESIASLKEKEVRLGMTLVLNGWDNLLVNGDAGSDPLQFDGIVDALADCGTAHTNVDVSGTFTAAAYDQYLAEACAKPTVLVGHPTVIQEVMMAYFASGFNGSQIIGLTSGDRLVPGFNFASFVNTAIGRLGVVADSNFPRANIGGGRFHAHLYSLRMSHNGVPLVYKITQIPLALHDLTPGCTTIAFEIWAKTALIVKHCCAHGDWSGAWTGRITTTCPVIL